MVAPAPGVLVPTSDPYLASEVDAVVAAVDAAGVMSPLQLSRRVGAQFWGPGGSGPQCARRWRQDASAGWGLTAWPRRRWPGCRREGATGGSKGGGGRGLFVPLWPPRALGCSAAPGRSGGPALWCRLSSGAFGAPQPFRGDLALSAR